MQNTRMINKDIMKNISLREQTVTLVSETHVSIYKCINMYSSLFYDSIRSHIYDIQ